MTRSNMYVVLQTYTSEDLHLCSFPKTPNREPRHQKTPKTTNSHDLGSPPFPLENLDIKNPSKTPKPHNLGSPTTQNKMTKTST
jgi:hypothetical protein